MKMRFGDQYTKRVTTSPLNAIDNKGVKDYFLDMPQSGVYKLIQPTGQAVIWWDRVSIYFLLLFQRYCMKLIRLVIF